mgnify:CR=1 FL=1|jgi:hypothetical protein
MPYSLSSSSPPIVKIEVTSIWCMESFPCQHNVRLTLKDDSTEHALLYGSDLKILMIDLGMTSLPFIENLESFDITSKQLKKKPEPFTLEHFKEMDTSSPLRRLYKL